MKSKGMTEVHLRRQFNRDHFEATARIALLMRMLEILGFPASSPEFAALERQAVEMTKELGRSQYLAFLEAQARFERMKKQIY